MKRKIEIITHGNTWIDTSIPIACPECAGLNVKEDVHNSTKWRGPFKISYSEKMYSCKDCNCHFKIDKDKTSIHDCSWDELFGWITLFTAILWAILIMISSIFWSNTDSLPLSMAVAIAIDTIIMVFSFFVWLVTV